MDGKTDKPTAHTARQRCPPFHLLFRLQRCVGGGPKEEPPIDRRLATIGRSMRAVARTLQSASFGYQRGGVLMVVLRWCRPKSHTPPLPPPPRLVQSES